MQAVLKAWEGLQFVRKTYVLGFLFSCAVAFFGGWHTRYRRWKKSRWISNDEKKLWLYDFGKVGIGTDPRLAVVDGFQVIDPQNDG